MIRKVTLSAMSLVLLGTMLNAQIYINTGNPNMDKYKQENPNATVIDGKQVPSSTPPSTPPATKTKTTKVKAEKPTPQPITPSASTPEPTKPAYNGSLSDANNDLPPNAEAGKCYARCFVPDQFEFKEEQVVDHPVSYKTQLIPAKYVTVFDTIVVRKESKRYSEVSATYETVTDDIMVSPSSTKWEKGHADAGCLSANPADCQVMCLVTTPAVYKKVSRKVVKTPAYKNEIVVPAEYKIVSRQVMSEPAQNVQIEIPATYKTVVKKELSKKGGYQEWREILCSSALTVQKILAIQKALKGEGYDPGPFDNVFGSLTKAALVKYQQDKGLPVGNLNIETLKALGVN